MPKNWSDAEKMNEVQIELRKGLQYYIFMKMLQENVEISWEFVEHANFLQ